MIHGLFRSTEKGMARSHMGRKLPNLRVSQPKCRSCGRTWRPAEGVVATQGYCKRCSAERRGEAAAQFRLTPISAEEVSGAYRLPRELRGT